MTNPTEGSEYWNGFWRRRAEEGFFDGLPMTNHEELCPCDCHWHPHGPYAWKRCVCRNNCPESSAWDGQARAHTEANG
jgi:hypothetical protein